MSVDLVLMPALGKDCEAAHDMLNCHRRYELFDEIRALDSRPVDIDDGIDSGVCCYLALNADTGSAHYGVAFKDYYGDPLRIVTVGELLKVSWHDGVRDNFHNRGIWRLLAEYPADWPVVLFWI